MKEGGYRCGLERGKGGKYSEEEGNEDDWNCGGVWSVMVEEAEGCWLSDVEGWVKLLAWTENGQTLSLTSDVAA